MQIDNGLFLSPVWCPDDTPQLISHGPHHQEFTALSKLSSFKLKFGKKPTLPITLRSRKEDWKWSKASQKPEKQQMRCHSPESY